MNKVKIFNDPVHGFISVQKGILLDLINHKYFQRLRRIKQLGLSHYVYPGALHTRFHHALGAMHLVQEAIIVLRNKGIEITDEESTSVQIAILLHDIGHGPFSHSLEHIIINMHHEDISILFMEALNEEYDGKLDLAIEIFKNQYHKRFLHQLVSGQLDMDRLDYLTRDSFFTGVTEGVIGYDRIIKMLYVKDNELVVEEKGLYSIEKFLLARKYMYWQVYLHKTSVALETMLKKSLEIFKELNSKGTKFIMSDPMQFFFENEINQENKAIWLDKFALLDDFDVMHLIKTGVDHENKLLKLLCNGIVFRYLFKTKLSESPFNSDKMDSMRLTIGQHFELEEDQAKHLVISGEESNSAYLPNKNEIKIFLKSGEVVPVSSMLKLFQENELIIRFFLCYPKILY